MRNATHEATQHLSQIFRLLLDLRLAPIQGGNLSKMLVRFFSSSTVVAAGDGFSTTISGVLCLSFDMVVVERQDAGWT